MLTLGEGTLSWGITRGTSKMPKKKSKYKAGDILFHRQNPDKYVILLEMIEDKFGFRKWKCFHNVFPNQSLLWTESDFTNYKRLDRQSG